MSLSEYNGGQTVLNEEESSLLDDLKGSESTEQFPGSALFSLLLPAGWLTLTLASSSQQISD